MGLFKFIKDAGNALKRKGSESDEIKEIVKDNQIEIDDLDVAQDGEKVVLKGKAKTQEAAEKAVIAAGNNAGIAEVESHIEVEAPAPEATFYTVVSGDTLSKIAQAHYGDAMKYPMIFEANKPMLTDPDKIYPGQVLRIPPAA